MVVLDRGVFSSLGREALIPLDLAGRLERMAGLRNVLVHGCTEPIAERVHAAFGDLDDIRELVAELSGHLEV